MAKSYLQQYIDFLKAHRETHCCKKLWQMYIEDLEPIVQGKSDKYYFDEEAGLNIIEFTQGEIPDLKTFNEWMNSVPEEYATSNAAKVRYIEKKMGKFLGFIRQKKGEWADLPLTLELFQKAFIEALYGIKRKSNGYRRFTESWFEVPRKNGKTTIQIPFALWGLIEEKGAEIYVASSSYKQSRRLWDEVNSARVKSPALSKRIEKRLNPQCDMYYEKNDSHFYALSKNTKTQDGFNSSMNIIDEMHALPAEVYSILKQATANTRQPITSMIGSAGTVRGGLFDTKYEYYEKILNKTIEDDTILIVIYELDDPEEMWDETKWTKANPGLGVIKKYEYLRDMVKKSESDITALLETQVKDFNIIGVSSDAWLTAATINAGAYGPYDHQMIDDPVQREEFLKQFDNQTVIGGFDLSQIGDVTAFSILLFDIDNQVVINKSMYWITTTFLESEDAKSSGVPWKAWINSGFVRISTEENRINYHDVADYVLDEFLKHGYYFQYINYDRWSASYLVTELSQMGWKDKRCLIPTAQGSKTMNQPMQLFESLMKDGKHCYLNNPVFKWMLTNVAAKRDDHGGIAPIKVNLKRANKIDGPVTVLNAYVSLCNNITQYLGDINIKPEVEE